MSDTTKTKAKASKKPAAPGKKVAPSKSKTAFGFATQASSLMNYIKAATDDNDLFYQVIDLLPIPVELFAPDGTSIFLNRALIEFNGAKDASAVIGKYNLIEDPVCNDQLGMRDGIQKAFRGEAVFVGNFPVPIDDLVKRGIIKEKPFESASGDYILYPVFKDDKLHLVVFILIVKGMYFGRPDVAKAKEYIDTHWHGEYDKEAVANAVNMSVSQLYNLFKQHVGMPPGEYHRKVIVDHIKEKLADKNLSIKEAFAACGEDSQGWAVKVFKEVTGISPKQFREELKEFL